MKQEWNLLWTYINNVIETTKLGNCKLHKQNKLFKDKYTDKGFVKWASNVDATTNTMMNFKQYIQLKEMINSANNTKFISEPFQNESYYEIVKKYNHVLKNMKVSYYESDNWTNFISYVTRRRNLEDMHMSSMKLIRENDVRNNHTEAEKMKLKKQVEARQLKKQATIEKNNAIQ